MQYTEFGVICRNMNTSFASSRDEKIRKEILLVFSKGLGEDLNLRVGVLNGIAHLAGTVNSMLKRQTAEELAKQVVGIRGVVNRIEAPGAPSPSRAVNLDLNN
ncbi:MAG: hypothetical protein ACD_34C00252G0006 [uncultured bacterium]|nr:MAG: hypothetical protein ACD_34C00252G0006 [uncultured bacterium]